MARQVLTELMSLPAPAARVEGCATAKRAAVDAERQQNVRVCVRVRPLSEAERARGDQPVWVVDGNQVCLARHGSAPKYAFETVHREASTNRDVYQAVGAPVVQSAVAGINGTIFAYGVTSSGKTHTMMGQRGEPGLVPLALQHLFQLIDGARDRFFLLKFSMLEIYNETINDLLDPASANLRLREDTTRDLVYVEGIKNVEVQSVQHALALVATGEAHRKVSSTHFNEGSSRSHTLVRVSIESCAAAARDDRTISQFNLIDLAGSESARVATTHSHRKEGGYINKSLLTLGAVISKLAEGSAVHIPFRDSKITRLLQGSLSGAGAKVAVVCCVTPAAAQAEETHNTLKFATRAAAMKIPAVRNTIADEKSQIMMYQEQILRLRKQLQRVLSQQSAPPGPDVDVMQQDLQQLRSQLESERQAAAEREAETASLQQRLHRLHDIVLNSSRGLASSAAAPLPPLPAAARSLLSQPQGAGARAATPPLASAALRPGLATASATAVPPLWSLGTPAGPRSFTSRATPSSFSGGAAAAAVSPLPLRSEAVVWPPQPSSTSQSAAHSAAGELHTGPAGQLSLYELESPYVAENANLKRHLAFLIEEIDARRGGASSSPNTARRQRSVGTPANPLALATGDSSSTVAADAARPAPRLSRTDGAGSRGGADAAEPGSLALRGLPLREGVMEAFGARRRGGSGSGGGGEAALQPLDMRRVRGHESAFESSCGHSSVVLDSPLSAPTTASLKPPTPPSLPVPPAGDARDIAARLERSDARLAAALKRLQQKEETLKAERRHMARFRELGRQIEAQLHAVTEDNTQLRGQLAANEKRLGLLQGYNLDALDTADLGDLIASLTSAVDRIRITTTLRELKCVGGTSPDSKPSPVEARGASHAPSRSGSGHSSAVEVLAAEAAARGESAVAAVPPATPPLPAPPRPLLESKERAQSMRHKYLPRQRAEGKSASRRTGYALEPHRSLFTSAALGRRQDGTVGGIGPYGATRAPGSWAGPRSFSGLPPTATCGLRRGASGFGVELETATSMDMDRELSPDEDSVWA